MIYDCVIIGGGPAGLNAALVLGRARRNVVIVDDGQPRNRVTHESHGYLTRDHIKPDEFRKIAYEEVLRYPSVEHRVALAEQAQRLDDGHFCIQLQDGQQLVTRKLLITAGIKEVLPPIQGVTDCYGKSLFNCPFCDGWELRDQPLAVIGTESRMMHLSKMVHTWSQDIIVFTNGTSVLEPAQQLELHEKGIRVIMTPIAELQHEQGKLQRIVLTDGVVIERSGGFVMPQFLPKATFHDTLGYKLNEQGYIKVDAMGQTSVEGLYSAGDSAFNGPSQLIRAAAEGSLSGAMIHGTLMEEDWNRQSAVQ
ncbi:NAD(P)/FAD-dependent oxidoreductase [Paenibacillus campi]|uniref:NAD(P)/FAD-dependent oxidoreductase n=1 Tax=Paenibacillus campi TaxID=3106031 RepID=UPI002AFF6B9B|nr:NAD(P)/FAD-dependent oxidoreductase [Paenibacillus sp. SGZ-1009]